MLLKTYGQSFVRGENYAFVTCARHWRVCFIGMRARIEGGRETENGEKGGGAKRKSRGGGGERQHYPAIKSLG